jgi:transcriptional regulator with XRE-family HTH domain
MSVEDFNKWRGECPIYVARKERKYTSVDLAGFLDVSRQLLNDWEDGRRPTDAQFVRLVGVFGKGIEKEYDAWLAKRPVVKG